MIKSFRQKKALKQILKDNQGKIYLQKGPLGHYWYDTDKDTSFDELKLPDNFQYPQHLYDDNGGGQFLIMDGDKQLGRINTYTGKKK